MTLLELQKILGERIILTKELTITKKDEEAYRLENEKSDMIARLAKQMINNADVVLRTDKLISEGKLSESTITKIVGTRKDE